MYFSQIGFMQKYTPLRGPAAKKWKCSRKVNHKITFEVPSAREGWVVVLNLKTFTRDDWCVPGVNIWMPGVNIFWKYSRRFFSSPGIIPGGPP